MLRVTRQTDYGIVLLTHLATDVERALSTRELAEEVHLPAPMVSKILKALTREGLVRSVRGARGGYRLGRPSEEISVADVIAALEGPIAVTECSAGPPGQCEHEEVCSMRSNWQVINGAVRSALHALKLSDMARPLRHSGLLTPVRASARPTLPLAVETL